MFLHPVDDRGRFLFQDRQVMRLVGVIVTGQRKLLPHEDSFFIAQFEERLLVDNSTTPYAQDVKIGFFGQAEQVVVPFAGNDAGKYFRIHPIGPFAEYLPAIDLQLSWWDTSRLGKAIRFVPGSFVHDQFDPAETYFRFLGLNHFSGSIQKLNR